MQIKLPDGRQLGFAQFGAGDGRPVLYFHGGLSSRLDIEFAHSLCKEKNVLLIAPDRPGIGLSDRRPERKLKHNAADIVELLDFLQIKSLPLIGWSVGGPYALTTAAILGKRISKVVTVGGAPPLDYPNAVSELGLLLDRIILTAPDALKAPLAFCMSAATFAPRPMLKFQLEMEVRSAPDRRIVKAMSEHEATDFIIEAVRQGGMGIFDDYEPLKEAWAGCLGDLKQPVQVWYGDEDAMCPPAAQKHIADLIPGSKLVEVSGAGHFLLHEKLNDILEWLLGKG